MMLAETIRRLRKDQGLSLDKLASATGMSKGYLWEIEKNKNLRPSVDKIAAIAAFFGVTVDYLLDDTTVDFQSALDDAFYNEYLQNSPAVREKIRTTMRVWKG